MGAGQQSSLTQIFIQDSLNATSLHAAVLLKGDVTVQLFKQFLFENDNWVYAGVCLLYHCRGGVHRGLSINMDLNNTHNH